MTNDSNSIDILEINRLQIIKRERPLLSNEIDDLLEIKERHIRNNDFIFCIFVLLESIEIDSFLRKVDKDELKKYQSRPIWNLINNKVEK